MFLINFTINSIFKSLNKSVLIALVLIIALGCSSNDNEQETDSVEASTLNEMDLPDILKKGKLVILAENSSTSYFIYRGRKMGFEFEILKEFASDLGIDLEIKLIDDLNEANDLLNKGEGDLIACNYTISNERRKVIDFSVPFLKTNQVLIQRKPDGWEKMSQKEISSKLINDPTQLVKKRINVWEGSTYYRRLMNLQEEIGDTIFVQAETGDVSSEDLIERVSEGIIDFTVVEKNIAQINSQFLDNIDIHLDLSVKQKIAFGLRKASPLLKARLDQWLTNYTEKPAFKYLKRKYFDLPQIASRSGDLFSSVKGGKLSKYDHIFKKVASKKGWDWRLLAAISFQESRFNPDAVGMGGAYGLMQFMPEVGPAFNVYPSSTPEVQIEGGMKFIMKVYNLWKDIPKEEDRLKFTLASYNSGSSHVKDAQRLAEKHGLNPKVWDDHVEVMMKNLSKKEYYRDPVVQSGSARGVHTSKYVQTIYTRYLSYKSLFR
jgi:membrane-bound lytic murein transglycosylase F